MISLAGSVAIDTPANYNTRYGNDKSIVDDFVASSYCKCESIPVLRSTEVFAAFLRFVLSYFLSYCVIHRLTAICGAPTVIERRLREIQCTCGVVHSMPRGIQRHLARFNVLGSMQAARFNSIQFAGSM